MWTKQHKQNRIAGRLIVPAITACFLSYFGFHAFHGDYGIEATALYDVRERELQKLLDEVSARRTAIEARVQLIHDGTLDRDMLDEQARRALNFSRDDEVTAIVSREAAP